MISKCLKLYKKNKEVINYLIFGVLTTIISLIVYYALAFTILDPNNSIELQITNIISWTAGVVFAYITNRKYVFESKNNDLKKEMCSFISARLLTLLIDMLIMYIGVTTLKGNDKIIKIISQIIVIISNYLLSKLLVFKKNIH